MESQLKFEVRNQIITRVDSFQPVAASVNYLLAGFVFKTGEWANTPLKTAIFETVDAAYKMVISNGYCLVPWEVLQNPGYISVSVFGGDRITTNKAKVYIAETGYVDDAQNDTEPTAAVYDQIMDQLNFVMDGNLDGGLFTDWNVEVES